MKQGTEQSGSQFSGIWVLVVLVVFHLIAGLRAWRWDSVTPEESYRMISPDLWFLLATASLLHLRFGFRWYFGHVFAFALVWIPLYRIPVVVFPKMFGKDFILAEEVGQVEGLWIALFAGGSEGASIWAVVLTLGACLAAWVVLYLLWKVLGTRLATSSYGWWLLAISGALLAVSFFEKSREPARASRLFSQSMYASTLRQLNVFGGRASMMPRIKYVQDKISSVPQDLGALDGADLIVVFVESYGRSLFGHERYGAVARQILQDAQNALKGAGHGSVSRWIESPVSGAQSQVAHASFLSGIPLRSYRDHDRILKYDARMLTHILTDLGYHSVNAQPKLEREWPKSFGVFGFKEDLFGKHTPYREEGGPIYHWAAAPDQYPLALAIKRFMKPSDDPLFLQLITGVSHAPYSRIPPYIEDWDKALDPKAYLPVAVHPFTFLDYHGREGVEDAYIATLRYTIEMLVGFVKALPRPALVLVLGDHQAPLTGSIKPDATDYAVPFHAMSNRDSLLDPMRELAVSEGMVPGGQEAAPMHRFLLEFLRAYRQR